jgi:beta-glucanase (GH16 family)
MRKVILAIILTCFFGVRARGQVVGSTTLTVAGGATTSNWTLVWDEEFNGTSLPSEFECRNGNGTQNPPVNESAFDTCRTDNISMPGDGYLHLTALHDNYMGHPYTTGEVDTNGLKGFGPYGAMEVRALLPAGEGTWPDIWMMPVGDAYGGWPLSGEIDIEEKPAATGGDQTIFGTLHFNSPSDVCGSNPYTLPSGGFSQGFHVFRFEWSPTAIDFFVDGNKYATCNSWFTVGHAQPAPFDQAFYLILDMAIGDCASWAGCPTGATTFPVEMLVDWAKFYTKK